MKNRAQIEREIKRLKLYGNNHKAALYQSGMEAALYWVITEGFVSPSTLIEYSVHGAFKRRKKRK